jgi:hypothetical protein
MQLSFRQGLVQYQSNFLSWSTVRSDSISLSTTNKPVTVTFSQQSSEYLLVEPLGQNATVRWTGLPVSNSSDFWIFWDIDNLTALVTYGFTTVAPVFGPIDPFQTTIPFPTIPATGQHWFDTSSMTMKVWSGSSWTPKIRVFAAKIENGSIIVPYPPGTQVGVASPIKSGRILRDGTGTPIKKANKTFVTSEDRFFIENSDVRTAELETSIVVGIARESIPSYSAVKLEDFNDYYLANYEDTTAGFIGMAIDSATYGESLFVTIQGMITNPAWDWQTPNAKIWIDSNGQLTDVNPGIATPTRGFQQPIARVISPTSIIFGQGYFNDAGTVTNTVVTQKASGSIIGITELSLDPLNLNTPIAVGDNDPRMSDARTPLAHTHQSTDVFYQGTPLDTTLNLIMSDLSGKVSKSGDTMTGFLTLNANPVANLQAATKQYVDSAANQTITLSGDISGSGTSGITTTLSNSGVTAGTYNNSALTSTPFTVDAKGRVTATGTPITITPDWASVLWKPTTLAGYGITDGQPLNVDLTAISNLATGTTGVLTKTGPGTWTLGAASSGASNTIFQEDTSLTITDSGTNGTMSYVVDGRLVMTTDTRNIRFFSGAPDSWVSVVESGAFTLDNTGGSTVKIDSLGNIITLGSVNQSSLTSVLVIKVDSTGNTIWQRLISDNNGTSGATADASAIDSQDNIIMAVNVNHYGTSDTQPILKLDSDGNILWQVGVTQNIDINSPPGTYQPQITDIVVDSSNDVYAGGFLIIQNPDNPGLRTNAGLIVKLSGIDGSVMWQQLIQDSTSSRGDCHLTGITYNPSLNQIYVCGNLLTKDSFSNSSNNGFVAAYDSAGNRQWISLSDVSGDTTHINDQAYDAHGNLVNYKTFSGITLGVGSTLHNSGGTSIYVCGQAFTPRLTNFCICEYIATQGAGITATIGELVTSRTYDNSYGNHSQLYEIVATPTELIAVGNPQTNTFGSDWSILKISLPSLTLDWSSDIGFASSEGLLWNFSNRCLDVRNNQVAVTGYTYQNGAGTNNSQMMTVKIPVANVLFSVGNCK